MEAQVKKRVKKASNGTGAEHKKEDIWKGKE